MVFNQDEWDKRRAELDRKQKYELKRIIFVAAGVWILFHVFGLWVLFTFHQGAPLGAAIIADVVIASVSILWRLSGRFIWKDEGQ